MATTRKFGRTSTARFPLPTTGPGPINEYTGATGRTSVLWGGLLNLSTRIGAHTKLSFDNLYTRTADNEAIALNGTYEEFSGLGDLAITRLTFTERTVPPAPVERRAPAGRAALCRLEGIALQHPAPRYEPDRSDLAYTAAIDPETHAATPLAWFGGPRSATRTFSDLDEDAWEGLGNYRLFLASGPIRSR